MNDAQADTSGARLREYVRSVNAALADGGYAAGDSPWLEPDDVAEALVVVDAAKRYIHNLIVESDSGDPDAGEDYYAALDAMEGKRD